MTSKNQSLTKQLEETNAKYDKLLNQYDLVTNELEYELRKQITVHNEGAPPIVEMSSDTFPNAEDEKRERTVTRGMPFLPESNRRSLTPSINHTQLTLNDKGRGLAHCHHHKASFTHAMFSIYRMLSKNTPIPQQDRVMSNFNINIQLNEPKVVSKPMFEKESPKSKCFGYGEYLEYWRQGHSNNVSRKYEDLKEELTNNNVAQITVDQYDELCRKAQALLTKKPLVAKQVGNSNDICGIEEGSTASVDHMIALLIYTDFHYHQCQFKKQCRKMSANESLQDLVDKNSEIHHWSKLIKELCIFYGEIMGEKDLLYTGIGEYLMFDLLCTRFECPISTSTKLDVAMRFSGGAIILKFERGSTNTRILDVTGYSCHGNDESERLVAGSTLRIVDIIINTKSHKAYVSALRMFEQIMNGHFIDGDDEIASKLICLLEYAISPTFTDKLRDLDLEDSFYIFLEDQGHDSDSITEDITEETSSDISKCFGSSIFAEVQKCSNDHAGIRLLD